MNKKIIILISLFFLGIGMGGGIVLQKIFFSQKKDANDTYASGWAAAKQRLIDTSVFQEISKNVEIKSISGIVKKIDNNIITIVAQPLEPLSDPNMDERFVVVDSNTKITAFIKKSDQQYQKELDEAIKRGNFKQSPDSPDGGITEYSSESVSISQIATGSQITINSNEDLRNKKQFTAKEILFGK
jgi:hypothetical protein